MRRRRPESLRANAAWRVADGFGGAVPTASRYVEPGNIDEMLSAIQQARRDGLAVTFRGAGRSYGDAALNHSGVLLDLRRLNRVIRWDAATGTIEVEPGVTIEDLWRHALPHGYWPAVVPGTMRPTIGGCLAMNIHGKNNYREGPFGDHVLDFDLVTPDGALLRCSRSENADVFHAAIGGLGLLGAITRVTIRLKKVETGLLRVEPIVEGSLASAMTAFEGVLPTSDYAVGWVDAVAPGRSLGRAVLHRATYTSAAEIADAASTLDPNRQDLPRSIYGVPKDQIWRLMRPAMTNAGVRLVNAARYRVARLHGQKPYLQSHVAFAFLLDYVPDWRLAYGPAGLIQYQVFVPHQTAPAALAAVIAKTQAARRPSYLGVLKRHRPDDFLLSHAVDGWSLALDFAVGRDRDGLWRLTEQLTEIVLAAGGRFYFAKDAVLRPGDVSRAYGRDRLDRFLAVKARLDPGNVLTSDLWRRVSG